MNGLLGSFLTIASQVDLNELGAYRLILAIMGMLFTWSGTMMALMMKLGKNAAKGKQLIFGDDDETQFLKRPIDNPAPSDTPKV